MPELDENIFKEKTTLEMITLKKTEMLLNFL